MAVAVYPLPLPQHRVFTEGWAEPNRRQAAGVLESGQDFVVDRGAPQWSLHLKTRTLNDTEMGDWKSWNSALRGAQRYFLGYDPRREYPKALMPRGMQPFDPHGVAQLVKATGGLFDLTMTLSGVGTAISGNDYLSFTGLPQAFAFATDDKLSFTSAQGRVSLHQILQAAVADVTGAVTLWVEPELPIVFGVGAQASLYRPCAKFRMIKFDAPVTADGGLRVGAVTIEALSVSL